MKKLSPSEGVLIALAIAVLIFTAGFFTGRLTAARVVTVTGLAADASPTGAATASPVPSASAKAPAVTGKININTATATELEALDGIGPVLAQRIVDYRTQYGAFQSISQIKNVSGIGNQKFEAIKDFIAVG
ncbi:helix-hairpin-helix domain-containing protein [Oscillospiraceae bacterium WX1]